MFLPLPVLLPVLRRCTLLAVVALSCHPDARAQEWVGFSANTTIGYTDRGGLGTGGGEVLVRLDAGEHGGWGADGPVGTRVVTGVRVAVRDINPFTPETFSLSLHNELFPGVPVMVGLPFGPPSPPVPWPITVFDITLAPCAAVMVPLTFTGHVYVSIHLPANLAWPLDGLEVGVVDGVPLGTLGSTSWDVAGPVYLPSHNLVRPGLPPAVPQATAGHYYVDVRHGSPCSSLAGGVGATTTTQISYPISGGTPGTADFLSGSYPDGCRGDQVSMTSKAAFVAPFSPVLFAVSFAPMAPWAAELPMNWFFGGATGRVCLQSIDLMTVAMADGTGFAVQNYPVPLCLANLAIVHQAFVYDMNTGFLHAGPCDRQQF